jgi:hypothetical protein
MEHRCSKVKSKKDIANFSAKDADRPPQALGFLDWKQLKRSLQWRIWSVTVWIFIGACVTKL